MKNKFSKKILVVLIFLLFLSITNNVFSAESWYFTLLSSEDYGATYQRVENGGYTSETECLKILNNNYASRTDLKPSTKCFLAEPATITIFTPSSGKLGDTITVTGKNFIKVTDVSVGGANANYTVNSPTSLDLTIPNAAVTGKIKIVTETRGTATSTSTFTISSVPKDMYWWYRNIANEFYGATGRLQTPGFIDEGPCNTKRLAYEKSSSQAGKTDPCFRETQTIILKEKADSYGPTPIGPAKAAGSAVSSVYTFLAPIGTMKEINTTDIGVYFNWIFKLAIGLCAALAVVMIIVGGVQYMGDESVFGKTDAKDRIMKAILGLLIAIGSWVLLNTINPALTGQNGVNVANVTTIVPLYDRGTDDAKKTNGESVRCTPVTTATSPCTVAKLTPIFGAANAVAMSKICNMESSGRVGTISSTDYCKPGKYPDTSFSYGIFQVNLSASGSLASPDCIGIFDKVVAGEDAIEPKYNSGFNCKILPGKENLFKKCRGLLLDTNKNLEIAKKLFTPDKGAWVGDKRYCASAFN